MFIKVHCKKEMFMPRILLLTAFVLMGMSQAAYSACIEPYPHSMVSAFMDSCAKDSKMEPFCKCLVDSFQKNIPLAEFIEESSTPGTVESDARFVKGSKTCAAQHPL